MANLYLNIYLEKRSVQTKDSAKETLIITYYFCKQNLNSHLSESLRKPINVIATANSIGVVHFNSAQQNKTLKN